MANQKPFHGVRLNFAHPLAQGLMGCWLANEGAGSSPIDLTGGATFGNVGTSAMGPTPDGPGIILTGYGDIELRPWDHPGGLVSFVSRIKKTADAGSNTQITAADSFGGTGDRVFQFRVNENAKLNFIHFGSTYVVGATTMNLHQIYDVAATYDGKRKYVYLDGIEDGSEVGTAHVSSVPAVWAIGARALTFGNPGTEPFTGDIYFLYAYNRGLSPGEVAALHEDPYQIFTRDRLPLFTAATQGGAGGVTSYTGQGGATAGGSATSEILLKRTATGGATGAGSAAAEKTLVYAGTGGGTGGGVATSKRILAWLGSGGASTGGVADHELTLTYTGVGGGQGGGGASWVLGGTVFYTGQGGGQGGGSATAEKTLVYASSGGVQSGGSSTSKRILTWTGIGGVAGSGSGSHTLSLLYTAVGGGQGGGSAAWETSGIVFYTGQGGGTGGGTAQAEFTLTYTSSGGGAGSGASSWRFAYNRSSSGGATSGGVATFSSTLTLAATGGGQGEGIAPFSILLLRSATGGGQGGGSADAVVRGSSAGTFFRGEFTQRILITGEFTQHTDVFGTLTSAVAEG